MRGPSRGRDPSRRWLRHLTEHECLDLLKSRHVGRVAYEDDGPVVLPVTYVVHHDTILFRTSPHGSLARHIRRGPAAFEVDDLHDQTLSGWSVLVRGPATYVAGDDLPVLDERPEPWPEGQQSLHVRITPWSISGRVVLEPVGAGPSQDRLTWANRARSSDEAG